MRLILVIVLISFCTLSCNKNSFTTSPQLKFKSVNATELTRSDNLEITLHLTDKEGDFTAFLGYAKNDLNCPAGSFADSSLLQIPQKFIDAHVNEGDVVIDLADVTLKGDNVCPISAGSSEPQTDTVIYSFWTKDRAGHISDTASTQPIIIHP